MIVYQLLTIFLIALFVFIPLQIDERIKYGIIIFAIILLPIFIKNLREDIQKGSITTILFILFLISCSISTIFSIDQKSSILQLMLYHAYFIIFLSIKSIFPTEKSKELLFGSFLLLVAILSSISLYNTLILKYVNREAEGVSFMWLYFGHNHLSALLLFAIPLTIYLLITVKRLRLLIRLLLFGVFILFLVTLLFSLARSSMIALLIAFLVVSIKKPKLFIFGLVFAVLILFFGILSQEKSFLVKKGRIVLNENYNRTVYWNQALENFKQNPIFGSGLKTFKIVNAKYSANKSRVLRTDSVHNFFLQMLSDAGILGFITSLSLIISILWQAVKKINSSLTLALFTGLLASVLTTLVDFDWQIATVFLIFWIFAGILKYEKD